ncbi:amidohydrolase family protein [Paenibacillus thalictri]|uniref:Amidohydrolase n=1 Tax=Paenibacillus thalictri TaxID=2527873 RepID=A0A4Q9DLF1_9BACL|nr:amidohydrolase family protein [Paenibacillus thalictri]TBL74565.1 amidohydrolase [Paenibacillus thalictri]
MEQGLQQEAGKERQALRIIDTDVHNTLNSKADLLEFLPKVWHAQWLGGELIGNPFYSPLGDVNRKDSRTDEGAYGGSDPHYMIKHHVERYGIDYAILTGHAAGSCSLHPDPDFGNAVASAYNDHLIEVWLKADPRYKGSMVINFSDPDAAVREIERVGTHPDIVQIMMCSGARFPFGQRYYHKIYEAAEHYGLPVAIHPGSEGKGVAYPPTPAGYPTRYFEWHNILPINYMGHINSLVCEGVFVKFPKLKFVAIEGGIAWLPHLMWRMDKNYKALRDSVPWLKRLPSEYIKEHIRLTTQPIEEPGNPEDLLHILRMIEAEKTVMFSSDYPHWDFDNPQMALPPMPRDLKRRILSETAMELYGLLPDGKREQRT